MEASHVAEISDVRNDLEALKKQHGDRGLELDAVREEKSSMILKMADLEKKVNESVADEERFNETRWKCSECSDLMEQHTSRICVPCGEKDGFLRFENGATLKILDVGKADKAVFCATCGLDNQHKGHLSLPYLKLKFLHDSGEDFAKIFDCVTVKTDGCTEQIALLKSGGEKILEVLKLLCAKAADLTSLPDYDDLFSHCEDVKSKYEELVTQLEDNIKAHVENANQLEARLQHVLKDEPFEEELEENKAAGDV